ncbi:MAG: hypothetical protein EOP05_14095 [Proteobacteria bacterium]|nr:MAG: hypothetical protein EOP05_14095 [Pseudomonadota bacterium]
MSASPAIATTTIDSVDESRVSAVAGITGSTDNPVDEDTTTAALPVLYGGVAGSKDVGGCGTEKSTVSTCNNCVATNTTSGDNGLLACNERRIHPTLQLRLFVKSDSIESGYPMATFVATTGTVTEFFRSNSSISKNSSGEVLIDWSEICPLMTTSSGTTGGSDTNCELTSGTDQVSIKIRVGVDAITNGVRGGTLESDESTEVQVILRNGIRADSSGVSILDTADPAVQYFEIGSGDKKAFIKDNLRATSGFPQANNIKFRWVRALYEKRESSTTPVWDRISSGSPHRDLEISGDASTSIDLTPRRIEDLDNNSIYDFKLAMVDAARNVGYYTPLADHLICDGGSASDSPETGPECHTARPSEVVGVLEKSVNCFVATAAYGSPMAAEVTTFRRFRDNFLVPNKFGRQFIWFYYKNGPIAAKFIAESDTLRAVSRAALWAPLKFAKFSLTYGIAVAFALLSTLILAPPAVWFGARRLRSRGPRA